MTDGNLNLPFHGSADDMLAGRPLGFYIRASWLFVLLLVIADGALIIIDRYTYLHWAFGAIVFFFVAWRTMKLGSNPAIVACGVTGFCAGLILAIFEIIWYHTWWSVFFLVSRPIWMTLFGLVAGFVFTILFGRLRTINIKGGS